MKNLIQSEYATRDGILKLLSDAEIAKLSTAEMAASLAAGDEYLDLERLGQGVQRANGKPTPMGRVLPRKSIQAVTWSSILAQLTAPPPGSVSAKA
jgi:hypothetical protein